MNILKIYLLPILFLFAGASHADASYYLSRRISVQDGLPSSDVYCILQDDDGFMWIGTRAGLCRFDGYNFYHFSSLGHSKIEGIGSMRMSRDHRQLELVTASHHKAVFDLHSSRFVSYDQKEPPREKVALRRVVARFPDCCFTTDREGHLFVSDSRGGKKTLQLVNNTGLSILRFNKYSIARNSKGVYYVATFGNGLFVYNPVDGSLQHFKAEDKMPLFVSNYLTCVFVDHNDNIWLGVENTGISLVTEVPGLTVRYLYPEPVTKAGAVNYIRAVNETPDGHLLLGLINGNVYDYNPRTGRFSLLMRTGTLPYDFLKDSRHTYIATISGLIVDGVLYSSKSRDHYLPFDWTVALKEDKYGRIWTATYNGGLMLLTWKDGRLTARQFLNKSYNTSRMRCLDLADNRWLWVGTNHGVYCVDTWRKQISERQFRHFSIVDNLPGNEISSIYFSRSGKLYVGFYGKGLCVLGPKGKSMTVEKQFDTTNGLSVNTVRSVNEDKFGNIWISQEKGIVRINQKKDIVANYEFSPSVKSNMFAEGISCKGPDGELYFGTMDGLLMLSGNISGASSKRIRITDFLVDGRPYRGKGDKAIGNGQRVELKYDQNSFTIFFSDFDYSRVSSRLYQYYMEGMDKGWHRGTILNKVEYSNLPPGRYVFHLRKMGAPEEATVMEVLIHRPWFFTVWAWMLYVALIGVLAFWIIRNARERFRLHQQIVLDRQLSEFRLNFFTHVAHEFRTPLAIIRSSLDKMREEKDVRSQHRHMLMVSRGVSRLSKLINQLMEFRKVSTGNEHLAVGFGDIVGFVKSITEEFWPVAEQKGISFTFLPFAKSFQMWFDETAVSTIVYNLLSNALKYTPSRGNVWVRMSKDGALLQLSFIDDGPGISNSQLTNLYQPFMHGYVSQGGMGIGLYMAHQMAGLHHGSLVYERREGKTVFRVTLPIDRSAYRDEEMVPRQAVDIHQQVATPSSLPVEAALSNPVNALHVAVIEDDPDMMTQIREELSTLFQVDSYFDGQSGMEGVKAHPPALLLCDVMLPVLDGYHIVRSIKDDSSLKHIPVIMLTALADEKHQIKAYQAGADDYVVKPYNGNVLIARVVQLIRMQRAPAESPQEAHAAASLAGDGQVFTSVADHQFLESAVLIMNSHLNDPAFTIDSLAASLHVGRTQLYGRMKKLTGLSPNKYMMKLRMEKASRLLVDGRMNIGEVCYAVGIQEQSYFYRSFKSFYGVSPSEYRKRGGQQPA